MPRLVCVVGRPSREERRMYATGLELYPLQSFSNAMRVEAVSGLKVVQGFLILEHVGHECNTGFLAMRHWWNARSERYGDWIDLTPQPDAFGEVILAEASTGDARSGSVLSEGEAAVNTWLLRRWFGRRWQPPPVEEALSELEPPEPAVGATDEEARGLDAAVEAAGAVEGDEEIAAEMEAPEPGAGAAEGEAHGLDAAAKVAGAAEGDEEIAAELEAGADVAEGDVQGLDAAVGAAGAAESKKEVEPTAVAGSPVEAREDAGIGEAAEADLTTQADGGGAAADVEMNSPLLKAYMRWLKQLLKLQPSFTRVLPAGVSSAGPVMVRPVASPLTRRFENAGRAFLEVHERTQCSAKEVAAAAAVSVTERCPSPRLRGSARRGRSSRRAGAVSLPPNRSNSRKPQLSKVPLDVRLRGSDLYKIIGVPEDPPPTVNDIKKAYRQRVLQQHPDKAVANTNQNFILLQQVYEYLCDAGNLLRYESWKPRDESLPSEKDVENGNFYNAFAPIFRREAQWSRQQPVPELGGATSTEHEVWTFYRFWYDFDSWRDVSWSFEVNGGEALRHLPDAQGREERRTMQKANDRVRAHFHVYEARRISELVDLARSYDPRPGTGKEAECKKKRVSTQVRQPLLAAAPVRMAGARRAAIPRRWVDPHPRSERRRDDL
eukprot:NODE_2001_length_2314_cov_7.181527.p1 GENE.NODE_2001_length_2314_cov_7.181527~~NODE_2001_length_2314_cov_7.181527.p1  ORF type:complete len:663 (+),score=173.23 NODE_2001_length_2314_cov_7.181527:68-2056(+)